MPPPTRPAKRTPERFDPSILARSVIAIPLLDQISQEVKTTARTKKTRAAATRKGRKPASDVHNVIIDINFEFKLTVGAAREVGLSRTEAAEPDPRTAAKLL